MNLNEHYIESTIMFFGGVVSLLYSLYYVQQLSIALGYGEGIAYVGSLYSLPVNITVLTSAIPTIGTAIHISYAMVVFGLILFALSSIQLFRRSFSKGYNIVMGVAAVAFLAITYLIETGFDISVPPWLFATGYIGAFMVLLPAIYLYATYNFVVGRKGMARNIGMDPLTPYTNMQKLSQGVMAKMKGGIKILDMHLDAEGLRNLAVMVSGSEGRFDSISVLASGTRLGSTFSKEYRDFRDELSNKNVVFDVRIMNPQDLAQQHERLLMDDYYAYKIPPLNIINKKSEHVVSISHLEAARRFDYLWDRATKYETFVSKQ